MPDVPVPSDNRQPFPAAWLTAARSAAGDAIAAGLDATRPLRNRVLSRAEARRKLKEAERTLDKLFALAERGFPPTAP